MIKRETATYAPASRQEWRQWLQDNHDTALSVWLLYYKKQSGKPTVSYSDAVDEALCYGWIDSTKKAVDAETFIQFFCRRKPNSVWSKINKDKVQRLTAEGLMTPSGYKSIETARQNGSWVILDDVEALKIPEDLEIALNAAPGAPDYFLSLSKSVRKAILQWLVLAKRKETRQKRISEIAAAAAQKLRPKQFG